MSPRSNSSNDVSSGSVNNISSGLIGGVCSGGVCSGGVCLISSGCLVGSGFGSLLMLLMLMFN